MLFSSSENFAKLVIGCRYLLVEQPEIECYNQNQVNFLGFGTNSILKWKFGEFRLFRFNYYTECNFMTVAKVCFIVQMFMNHSFASLSPLRYAVVMELSQGSFSTVRNFFKLLCSLSRVATKQN